MLISEAWLSVGTLIICISISTSTSISISSSSSSKNIRLGPARDFQNSEILIVHIEMLKIQLNERIAS